MRFIVLAAVLAIIAYVNAQAVCVPNATPSFKIDNPPAATESSTTFTLGNTAPLLRIEVEAETISNPSAPHNCDAAEPGKDGLCLNVVQEGGNVVLTNKEECAALQAQFRVVQVRFFFGAASSAAPSVAPTTAAPSTAAPSVGATTSAAPSTAAPATSAAPSAAPSTTTAAPATSAAPSSAAPATTTAAPASSAAPSTTTAAPATSASPSSAAPATSTAAPASSASPSTVAPATSGSPSECSCATKTPATTKNGANLSGNNNARANSATKVVATSTVILAVAVALL